MKVVFRKASDWMEEHTEVINIDTIEDILDLCEKYGHKIIVGPPYKFADPDDVDPNDLLPQLLLYDDYLE